ncbi:MAG: serine/threonine protein kinase [Gemmataceae bacterium]|jgi:serine/threonine-protein kinase|nr:serine/threonine protein kinase [Gemmataceae bacterium]
MLIGQTIGPFTIEKELGSGAMGTVYRAKMSREGHPDRLVALKVISFALSANESALARFEREAKILKQLKHPNIVRLLASGSYRDTPFFAMEYIEGKSLDRIIQNRRLSWEEVVDYGRQLCAALQHAHEKGIIHRDLKPSNLMITNEGILKLTDFGIAKDVDVTALTGANNTIGTAAYMSPEQCRGEKNLTGRSDLYSLGIVFYELLTGQKPFNAESPVDMFLMHVNGKFVRPAKLNPDIPIWLDNLVCQLMEKSPDRRPLDAETVGRALEEISEKVHTQRSVGADVANARAIDRPLNEMDPNAQDRSAAQAIRAGKKKKKLRKKSQPFYTKGWFVIIACILLIGLFGYVLWEFAIRPPSQSVLLARIEGAKENDSKLELISRYFELYGKKEDEITTKVRGLQRDILALEKERVLMNRYSKENLRAKPSDGDDPDAYRKTMAAFAAEDDGDTAAALTLWKELSAYSNDPNPEKAVWGWVADKHQQEIVNATKIILEEIARKRREARLGDRDNSFADDFERQAADALRLEEYKDFSRAYERWTRLRDLTKADPTRRSYKLLAASRAKELLTKKDKPDGAERLALVNSLIELSREPSKNVEAELAIRRNARFLLRELAEVYANEPGELGKAIELAKKLVAESPK